MSKCRIQNIAFGGDGVGRENNFVLFVPFTLPNELVEVEVTAKKKQFGKARLQQILEPNPNRISAPCPYFTTCGGCQLQHASYPLQLQIKKLFIEDCLHRIGRISIKIPEVIPSQKFFSYRRHITLKAKLVGDTIKLGFTAIDGHSHVTIDSCLLFHPLNDPLIPLLENALGSIHPALLNGAAFKLLKNEEGKIVLAAVFPNEIEKQELQSFIEKLSSAFLSGWILKTPSKVIEEGNTFLSFSYQGMKFEYSAFGFVQNHEEQSQNIYDFLSLGLRSYTRVLDLYCGIGVSSLALAKQGKDVMGIELNPLSIELAQKNAARNNVSNAQFLCMAAEDLSSRRVSDFGPDSAIINPPKTGLDPQIITLLVESSIKAIFYVSCNPSTLARDIKRLTENGFSLEGLQGFDMFPQTTHVETIARLYR